MLKKLVKYGNSNAIILDKAILELLEIEEGAVIKIKTDGKSLIITPHVKAEAEKVHETFTHDQATIQAHISEGFKQYKNLDQGRKEQLTSEYADLIKKHQTIMQGITQDAGYIKEAKHIAKTIDSSSSLYMTAIKALMYKTVPELQQVEQEMAAFNQKHMLSLEAHTEPIKPPTAAQQAAMEQEFFAVHKKNAEIYQAYGQLMNNPEYQHQAQLIAEKYGSDKNSTDYIEAINALTDAYLPEHRKAQEELKAIAQKYTSK